MIPFHFGESDEAPAGSHAVHVPPKLATKTDLLAFLGLAIPLPDYFGQNWDALEECLHDSQDLTLIHQDIPLEKMPDDQRLYLQILGAAARESDRISILFPETCREQIVRLVGQTE